MLKGKTKRKGRFHRKQKTLGTGSKDRNPTGTYMLDKLTGRLVKVSSRIPSLSKSEEDGLSDGDKDMGGADDASAGNADWE